MNKLHWEKLGQIFDLKKSGNASWMVEQAQNPYAIELADCIRVYFNTRPPKDEKGNSKSLAGYVDYDKNELFKIKNISQEPIIEYGSLGTFDEFGIMSGCVAPINSKLYSYYVGWTRKASVPYNWEIGLAISDDGGKKFKKYGKGPLIGATPNEPFLQAGCSCIFFKDGKYVLFYTSGIAWLETKSKPESSYQIMKATSADGIHWERDGKVILPAVIENESQASPTVKFWNGKWHLLFSYRHSTDFRNKERGYRIGYATSADLLHWERHDNLAGLDVSESGWDSEMVCYPNLFEYKNDIYIFYCGNDFGKEGFGVARLKK